MDDLRVPLSQKELDRLSQFLMSDTTPEDCMDLVSLDGFLTALIVGPDTILPSEWLPVVWGDDEGPQFETVEQAQDIMSLIMRHMNSIIKKLMETPDEYGPILYKGKRGRKTFWVADDWCWGFMQGVSLRTDSWTPFLESKSCILISPIVMFATDEGWDLIEKNAPSEEAVNELVDQIAPAVVEIYEYWLPHRRRATALSPQIDPKGKAHIGRNAPCPCGSGKKYKLCCGNPNIS